LRNVYSQNDMSQRLGLEGEGPSLGIAVLTCRCEGDSIDPQDAVDSSAMRISNVNSLGRILDIPDKDASIQRTRSHVLRIGRPSDAADTSRVIHPSGNCPFSGFRIPDDEFSVVISGNQMSSVRRKGQRSDKAIVAREDGAVGELISAQIVQVDGVVFSSNCNLRIRGIDGDGVGLELGGVRRDDFSCLDENDAVAGGSHGQSGLSNSDGNGTMFQLDGIFGIFSGRKGSRSDSVIHRRRNEILTRDKHLVDLIGVSLSLDDFGIICSDFPSDDVGVVGSGVQVLVGSVVGQSGDELVVSADNLSRLGSVVLVQVVDVSAERDRDDGLSLPQDSDLHVFNLRIVRDVESLQAGSALSVPQFDGLVRRSSDESLGIGTPRSGVDGSRVSTFGSKRSNEISGLSVVQEGSLVRGDGQESVSIGRESNAVDESSVFLEMLLELEGRSFQPSDLKVLGSRGDSVGSSLLEVARGDGLGVSRDLSDRGSGIKEKHGTELFLALSDGNDSLAVIGPLEIEDGAGQNSELDLQDVLLLRGVPDSDSSSGISGGDVETRGRISGHRGCMLMLTIGIHLQGILQASDDDGISTGVQEILSLWISSQQQCLATNRRWRGGVDVL